MPGFWKKGRLAGASAAGPAVRWDLHAHLLPGVDDGVRTLDEALEAVRALQQLGYRGSVLTPHVYKGLYDNSPEGLAPALAALRRALAGAGLDYAVALAAEYFVDEHLLALAGAGPLLGFGPPDRRHVLVELPYTSEPLLWGDAFGVLQQRGYTPVLAHPERYRFVAADPDTWLGRFSAYAIKYQCNIGSLVGQYGAEAQAFARRLLDEGLPTFWGTDLHRPSQVARFVAPGLSHLGALGALNRELDELV